MHSRWIGLVVGCFMAGCAAQALGPTVQVLPGRDRTFTEFQRDDVYCRDHAAKQSQESPQALQAKATAQSALLTAAIGAASGAVIGGVTGSAARGAAIGGASGGVVGAAGGLSASQRATAQLQEAYNTFYAQCLYAQGHQIPSLGMMSR